MLGVAKRISATLWGNWIVVTLVWFFFAVWVVVAIKHEKHKSILSVLGALVSTLLLLPFALRQASAPLRNAFRSVRLHRLLGRGGIGQWLGMANPKVLDGPF